MLRSISRRIGICLLFAFAGSAGLFAPGEAQAQCTTSLANGVNTRTCTGTVTGQQQVRGGNTEERLILESGTITSSGNGILGRDDSGAGKVTVQIDGGTVDASGIGINFDMGRSSSHPNGHSNVDINGGTIEAGGTGVNINHRDNSTGGRITFDMSGGLIGAATDDRIGATGLSAGIQATTNSNAIDIDMTGGSIYATERGMSLSHRGTGTIDVDIGSGATIDTLGQGNRGSGLWISRSGDGNIEVGNAGRIVSAGHDGIFILNEADGVITINHMSGGSIEAAANGIYVRQGSNDAGGVGAVSVTSGGDIMAGLTGIFLDLNRGDAMATDRIDVSLTGGTIRAGNTGVFVNSRTRGGLMFDMRNGASIGAPDAVVGVTGASLSLNNTSNANNLDVDSGGTIHARLRGLSLSHAGSGDINIDLTRNSRINTQESLITVGDRTLTRGAGVFAFHSGTGDIDIDHAGTINSGRGTGIYAQHAGTGNLSIVNSGMIDSGFQGIDARRSGAGRLDITHSGSITASFGPGIFARHDGARTSNRYDVSITIEGDVTTTDPLQAAVRTYNSQPAGNAGVRIRHTAGTVTGFWGIFASSARFSGSTWSGQTPADFTVPADYPASDQPEFLVTVGGGDATARIVARGLPGSDEDFAEAQTPHQVGWASRSLAGANDMPSGITVGGGDYQRMAQAIAAGDKEQTGVTPELRSQFRAIYRAAQAYGAEGRQQGNILDPRNLVSGFTGDPQSDADIDAWLTGEKLSLFREFTLTAEEKAVLEAAFGRGDLDDALDAMPESYSDDWKNTVRWYNGAYNSADFRVEVRRNGIIESEGDGIRLIRRVFSDDNGASFVLVGEGARVIARRYGVRMAGAGIDESTSIPEDPDSPIPEGTVIPLRKQTVVVRGHLESTGPDGVAIALRGGGYVIVGPDTTLRSASGTTIRIDEADPGTNLIVEIQMKEGEDIRGTFRRAVPGRIVNAGRTRIWVENDGRYSLLSVRNRAGSNPPADPADRTVLGAYDSWMDCDGAGCGAQAILAPRARVYEALPAMLLDMNDVSAPHMRAGIRRDGTGAWIGVIASSARRDLRRSTANTSYNATRRGVIAGWDFGTDDTGTLGLFFHHQSGTAKVSDGGKIDNRTTGVGVTYRRDIDPLTIGLRASVAFFSNDLKSSLRGPLANELSGIGYTVGIDAGSDIPLPEGMLRWEAGLTHAAVRTDDFTSVLRDPNALSGTSAVRVTDVKGRETRLHVRAAYEYRLDATTFLIGPGFEVPLDSRATVRAGNTSLSSAKSISFSLHGGIALDDVFGGGGSAALSLAYVGQSGGGDIRMNLAYRF